MATSAKQITPKDESPEDTAPVNRGDEATIASRAYELWLARGCPQGSPEEDWYRAEQGLGRTQRSL